MITDEIRSYILADSQISGLIGNRVYAVSLPQEIPMPAMTFLMVSHNRENTMDGIIHSSEARLRFHIFAETYGQVKILSQLLRRRLETAASGVADVNSTSFVLSTDAELETDLDLQHRIVEFKVYFNES